MAVDAQRLISVSFGKIATYRKQRGGLNLRKNLLVSYVIHNARTAIYEQMYGIQRLHEPSEQEDRDMDLDCTEEDDETEKPAWSDSENNDDDTADHEPETARKTDQEIDNESEEHSDDDKENSNDSAFDCEDKENKDSDKLHKADSCCHDRDRRVLGEVKQTPSTVCSQTCCNKRKRTELEEACESISPKRCKFDSEENAESVTVEQTQISSLVSRFNTGLSSLADRVNNIDTDSLSTEAGSTRNQRVVSCLTHGNSTQVNTSSHLQCLSVGRIENWARPIEAF
ncbi:immediate early response gene 5-like protein [Ptychodera flava]|uniref:immediate early response gene 5-like protein n=1 Tax=Ptychodera flava TaxID=63121 RepID=UPI00396A731D